MPLIECEQLTKVYRTNIKQAGLKGTFRYPSSKTCGNYSFVHAACF